MSTTASGSTTDPTAGATLMTGGGRRIENGSRTHDRGELPGMQRLQRGDPGERTPTLERTRVAEAMHWGVITCEPSAGLPEVAGLMAANRVHCVVVPTLAAD